MSFINDETTPIEWWAAELAELIAVREGLQKRSTHLRILESLGTWIYYYEAGMTPKRAFAAFWKEGV